MHSLNLTMWNEAVAPGELSVLFDNDQLTGLPGIWTQEIPIGSPTSGSGTFYNSEFATTEITAIDFFVDGIQINLPGEVSISDVFAENGTWAFSYSSKLFTDNQVMTCRITRDDGQTAEATVVVRMDMIDPTRLASGHPEPDPSDWTWLVVPTFTPDAGLPVASTSGFEGGIVLSGTPRQLQLNASVEDGTVGTHEANLSVIIPDGVTLRIVTLVGGATFDVRDFSGPIIPTDDVVNATLASQEVLAGELIELNFQTFGGSAVLQYMQIEHAASAGIPTAATDEPAVAIGAGDVVTNSGTWGHAGSDAVTLSATIGNVTKNGNGTWDWSHTPALGEDGATVTITADDGSNTIETTFALTVYNALFIDIVGGDDSNSGKTPALAVATPGQAAEIAEGDSAVNAIFAKAGQTMATGTNAHSPMTRLHANAIRFDNLNGVLISTYGGTGVFTLDGTGENIFGATPEQQPNATAALLDIRNCTDTDVENWISEDSSHSGIAVRSRSAGAACGNVRVRNCASRRSGGYGMIAIDADGGGVAGQTLTDIEFSWNEISDPCLNVETLGIGNAGGEALSYIGVNGGEIHHNHIYSAHKESIDIKSGCSNIKEYKNYDHDQFDGVYKAARNGVSFYVDAAQRGCYDIEIFLNLSIRAGAGIVIGNESGGLTNKHTERVKVHNNLVYDSHGPEVVLSGNGPNPGSKIDVEIYHNTFVARHNDQFVLKVSEADIAKMPGFKFVSNILARELAAPSLSLISVDSGVGNSDIDNNLIWDAGDAVGSVTGSNPVLGDPVFASLLLANWWDSDPFAANPAWARPVITIDHAIAAGSAALDASTRNMATTDLIGNTRTNPQSLGALELAV